MRTRLAAALKRVSDRRTRVRRRLEEVFSRKVLGAVAVTSALMKILESLIHANLVLAAKWAILSAAFVLVFVYWERVAGAADKAVEKAAEKAEEATKE